MSESPSRYLALDVFRGMTICFMIIVNSPGTWEIAYAPLLHAPWHGFTPTDLVFPSFLFAVGNAMAFVMHKFDGQPESVFLVQSVEADDHNFHARIFNVLVSFLSSLGRWRISVKTTCRDTDTGSSSAHSIMLFFCICYSALWLTQICSVVQCFCFTWLLATSLCVR
jgi:hypothetical protein